MAKQNVRADHGKGHRTAYEKNKKKILATQTVCALCGQPVDKNLKYPHPLSATVDHIIPLTKGGHPSDIENLQLAHFVCNRQKADKLPQEKMQQQESSEISNRDLPWSCNWLEYRSE